MTVAEPLVQDEAHRAPAARQDPRELGITGVRPVVRRIGAIEVIDANPMVLHKAGKHDESVKLYEEAAKLGSIQLTRKQ